MKILVVDDNKENTEMLMTILRSKIYQIIAVNNGQEALEKLRSVRYDLIISDTLMPVMDGFQLCRECKKDIELCAIPFIFYSATFIDETDKEFALSLGAQKFIRKPQKPEIFLQLIQEVVEKSKKQKKSPLKHKEQDEKEILKLYSEPLIAKLEKKNLDLENEIAAQKRTISKFKESEERYKTLFTDAQEAIFIADAESGILLDCNEAACLLVERQKEELVGKRQSIIHPADAPEDKVIEAFRKHAMKPDHILSSRVVTKSGIIKDVEIKAKVHMVKGKKIMQGFFHDITEEKRTEEELFKEKYLLNSLIDTIPDNIYFKDSESRFIRINKLMAKRFGLNDPQEALGKTDFDFFDEEHARPAFEDEQRIIATGEPIIGLEEKEVWPDGHISWVSTTKMPSRDKNGGIMGIMGISRDITERKMAEKALQMLSSRYEAMLRAVPDIIIEVDANKVYTWTNKAGLDFFGEDVIGREAQYYFEGEQDTYDQVQPIFAGDEGIIYIESWQRRKDGQKRLLAWWCRVLKDDNGNVTGALSTARDVTDRKLAEETLIKERTLLRTLIDNLPNGVFVKDKEYRKVIANALHIASMACHLSKLGLDPDIDIIGKTDFEVVSKENADRYFADDQKVIRDGQSIINKEEEGFGPDGKKIWLLISKIPIRDHDGKINGMIGITTDITERKLSLEAVIKERSLLRTLIDNLPNGVFVKDREYRKIIVNPIHTIEVMGHLKHLGMNAEIDILGKTDFEVFPEKLAKKFFTDDQKIVRDGLVILNNEGLGYYEDGKQQWLLVSKIPLRDKNGEIIGMVGVTTDITERRYAEEALKTSEQKFRTIFDNASDGMFLLDPEARKFVMCNLACLKMLGYSNKEFLNLDIAAIHPSEELSFIFEQLEKTLKGEEEIRRDIKFKRKDGTIFSADLSPTRVTIADKSRVLIVFRDITERLFIETELRTAKEKAEESDKLKTAFLQNMSHEVRTPLNGIIGFSDMITNPDLTTEKREQYFKIIRNSGDQLVAIVNDIITVATIEAGQEKPHEKESDINKLLQSIKSQYFPQIETKNLSFSVTSALTDDETFVLVDETKLHQILSNLVSNAIKFTTEGYIKIDCRLEGNYIKFTIEDTGIGILPEKHEIIFDRFFQIDYSETRSYGGTGLGLSIVKSYVHYLNGEIYLDSKPGKGSTFYFTIPYVPVIKEDKSAKVSLESENEGLAGKVILIAEDDNNNYEYLQEVLLDEKVKIIRAKNGKEAVEMCKSNPEIDLVLMDIKMPVLDGNEATKQILKFRKNLPIVAQTAYALLKDRQEAIDSGCVDYISKPINHNKLMEILVRHLK